MMLQIPRPIVWVLTLLSASALAAALTSQYQFGLEPCHLCIYQRVPYAVVIALGVLSLVINPRAILALMGICFLIGAGIAGFHAGVEYGLWKGTEACGLQLDFSDLNALRDQIMNAPKARCDEPAWSMFGISMAGYNFFYSLTLAIIALSAARK